MKIHITAVVINPLTKEEHEEILESLNMSDKEFIDSLYPEIRKGIAKGYCSKDETVWVKNVQIGW
jgi:hypothetical protein